MVHVSKFGAVGNGITDDTVAIQQALDAGDRYVEFSGSTYKISAPLYIRPNTLVEGNNAQIIASSSLIHSAFIAKGVPDTTEINLAVDLNKNSSLLVTTTPHGIRQGETFRLVGQRIAASADASNDDRLSMSTPNATGPWFGEYVTAQEVIDATRIRLSSGLYFNGYRTDKTQETHPDARERTTLNSIAWAENITLQNFVIRVNATDSVRIDYGKDVFINNIRDYKTGTAGSSFSIRGCLRTTIQNCHAEISEPPVAGSTIYSRNLYKIIASQNCALRNSTSQNGSQVADVSYNRYYFIPSIANTIENCVFAGFTVNAITIHPGCWGQRIVNNECRASDAYRNASGIGCRAPYSIITGNTLQSAPRDGTGPQSTPTGNYGICLYDGGGHHTLISNNHITGFDRSIAHQDGNEAPERHGVLAVTVTGNHLQDFVCGFALSKSTASGPVHSALTLSSNTFTSGFEGATGIQLDYDGQTRFVMVNSNNFVFSRTTSVPIRIGKNAKDPVLTNNIATGAITTFYETEPYANNGTIAMRGNVLSNNWGTVRYYD